MSRQPYFESTPPKIDEHTLDNLARVLHGARPEQLRAMENMLLDSILPPYSANEVTVEPLSAGGNSKAYGLRIPGPTEEPDIVAKIGSRIQNTNIEHDALSALARENFMNIPRLLCTGPDRGVLIETRVPGASKLSKEFTERDITELVKFILHLENRSPEKPMHKFTRHGEDPFCSVLPIDSKNPGAAHFSTRLRWTKKQHTPPETTGAKPPETYLDFKSGNGLHEEIKDEIVLHYIREKGVLERYATYRDYLSRVMENYPPPDPPSSAREMEYAPPDFRVSGLAIHPPQRCFTHGDMSANNILFTKHGEVSLIDFEHAGFNHPGYDVATLVAHNTMLDLPLDRRRQAIEEYENRSPQPEELVQRLRPLVVATHILWAARSILGTSEKSLARRVHANPDIDIDAYVRKQIENTERHFDRIETYLDEFDL